MFMGGFLIRLAVSALALWLTDMALAGVQFVTIPALVGAALVLGILNAIVRPVIVFLTLPLNILTLGLFTFVINAGMLALTARLVPDFRITGFWPALQAAVVMAIVSAVLNWMVKDKKED